MLHKHSFLVALLLLTPLALPAAQDLELDRYFTAQQLERMVAPIALYPDALLAQILIAATHPEEVQEAARWYRRHSGLRDDALEIAVANQRWDHSVKTLLFLPTELKRLDSYQDWTEDLGIAFINQEADLMEAVQRLRWRAQRAGHLESNTRHRVRVVGRTILIQPADPIVVYVPTYNPQTIYVTGPAHADSQIQFGAGAVVGGLLTAAILWDETVAETSVRNQRRVYDSGEGRRREAGYWHRQDYWEDGGQHPERWHPDPGSNHRSPPMQPWMPSPPPGGRHPAPRSDRLAPMDSKPFQERERPSQETRRPELPPLRPHGENRRPPDTARPVPAPSTDDRVLEPLRPHGENRRPPDTARPVPAPSTDDRVLEPLRPHGENRRPPDTARPVPAPSTDDRVLEPLRPHGENRRPPDTARPVPAPSKPSANEPAPTSDRAAF